MSELIGMMRSLQNDFAGQAGKLICVEEKLDNILAAFPTGGLMNHRVYHEQQIASEKSASEFRASVMKNVASGGAWATIVIVAYALWEYFKLRVNS